jgi:hypothetical protein
MRGAAKASAALLPCQGMRRARRWRRQVSSRPALVHR